jgi:hypothetical protein
MSTAQIQSPVQRLFEKAFNQGELDVVDEVRPLTITLT